MDHPDPRARVRPALVLALLLVFSCGLAPEATETPAENDGLVAWYRIDSLHRNHNDGELVLEWPDSSGRGHRLVATSDGVRAVFQTRQVNLEPVVQIRANTAFRVVEPFELQDHTIFVVFDTRQTRRALFHDDTEDRRGLILFDAQRYHRYAWEDPEKTIAYSRKSVPRKGFSITVLARREGLLGCLVNGVDLSSGDRFDATVRVGGFFFVRPTAGGRGDADGMRVAEMIFYNRRLDDDEIAGVTAYLAGKYAIEVVAPEPEPEPEIAESVESDFLPTRTEASVWLGTLSEANVNPRAIVLPWQTQLKVDAPFRHDPGDEFNSRLVCTQDGTRAEMFVRLPVRATAKDTRIQLLILKNGEEYLAEYGDSGPIVGKHPPRAAVEFKTTLDLNAGDFVEIVVRGIGERGNVIVEPHTAALVVRIPQKDPDNQ